MLTILDHKLAENNNHVLGFDKFQLLEEYISKSDSIIIYGTFLNSLDLHNDEKILLDKLETKFPVIKAANCSGNFSPTGWHIRRNIGRDLGLLKDILHLYRDSLVGKNIVWLNSSCIWDPDKLLNIIESLNNSNREAVSGLTDSWLGGYHLQTYFLHINRQISDGVMEILLKTFDRNWRIKRTIVHRGERRLTSALMNNQIEIQAVFPAIKVSPKKYLHINTYTDEFTVLFNLGYPCKKRNL
jgi:hypothetical protein